MADQVDWNALAPVLGGLGEGGDKKLGYAEGFGKSFLWSFPELVGVEAPSPVQQWRGENPVSGIGSQLLGFAIPYGGWASASTKIPRLAGAMEKVASAEKLAEAPFKAAAAKEIVRFAPFEAARVAAGASAGSELAEKLNSHYIGTGALATEAAVNLAASGLIGGAFEAFRGAGKASLKLSDIVPGANLNDPPQIQMRALQEAIDGGKIAPDLSDVAQAKLNELGRAVRLQTTSGDGKYVHELDSGSSQVINRMFKHESSPSLERKRLIQSTKNFENPEQINEVLGRAGIEDGWESQVQYPRYLAPKDTTATKLIDNAITKNLKTLDDGWYWGRDGKDGMFVMARRLPTDKATGEWLLFKTDNPGRFVPSRAEWADAVVKRSAWLADPPGNFKPIGAQVFDEVANLKEAFPLTDYRGLEGAKGNIAKVGEYIAEKTGLKGVVDQGGELGARLGSMTREYLSPTMFQFGKNPVAHRIAWVARQAYSKAEGLARSKFFGDVQLPKSGNLYKAVIQGAKPGESSSIATMIDDLYKDPEEVLKFWRAVNAGVGPDEAVKSFGVGEKTLGLLKELDSLDQWNMAQKLMVQAAFGESLAKARPNHYMISHSWQGTWRAPIYDEVGNLIGVGAGKTRQQALNEANGIIKNLPDQKLRIGTPDTADWKADQVLKEKLLVRGDDSALIAQARDKWGQEVYGPSRSTHLRTGVKGYVGETQPWQKDELKEIIHRNLLEDQKYLADLTVRRVFEDDLTKLRQVDFGMFRQLLARLDDFAGNQGPIGKLTNQVFDRALSPVLGKNSATTIVSTANKWMAHLSFGFFNVSHALANTLTFLQTSVPHLAYLTTAAPERIAHLYSWWPVAGTKSVDGMGVLDIFKIARQSFREMGRPDAALRKSFERAAAEGVWDPAFIEEFVGQNSRGVLRLKEVMKGEQPFSKWLSDVAMYLPAQSEKFSRGHSFVLGHIVGRDVFGFTDDMLYRFAKEFTEKTQFLYGTADRARIITSPFGSAFGLFKNWMMHYIGWMMEYTGEGVMHGNWKPLLWMTGGTAAIGGVGALPFYETANGVSQWMNKKTAMQNIYSAFGGTDQNEPHLADAVFYGLPAFLGFSIQNQVSSPLADPGRDAAMLFNFAYADRMKAVGRAIGSAIDNWQATGTHPAGDAQTRDALIKAFAPKTIYRWAAMTDGNLRSMTTGYPMLKGMSGPEQLMYGLGMNPRRVELAFRVNQELWSDQEKMKKAVQSYGTAWADAVAAKDYGQVERIVAKSLSEGIDLSAVIKSAKTRMAKGREDMISRQFSPQEIVKYRSLGLTQ